MHATRERLLRSMLVCEGQALQVTGEAVPVELDTIGTRGVLLLNADGTGQLTMISSTETCRKGETPLKLVNQKVFPSVAFTVLM